MTFGIIYCAICVATRKAYVGQTWQGLEVRRDAHYKAAKAHRGDCPAFEAALRKYPRDQWRWCVLYQVETQILLDEFERIAIAEMKAARISYNIRDGGKGGRHSAQTRRKIGNAHRGKKQPPEAVAKTSAANRGRKNTAQTRKKIGDAQRGRKRPAHVGRKISAANTGRKHTPKTRANMSAAAKRVAPKRKRNNKGMFTK